MIKKLFWITMLLTAVLLCSNLFATTTNKDILRKADQARGNLSGITWNVVVESLEHQRPRTMTFEVNARGFDILANNTAPHKYKGNKLLMINGNMWFYRPGLSKPVPISRRQRLLGNAAYGDIAATNYADDYLATLLEDETVDGEDCFVFDLKSNSKNTTYDRIKYWISKERRVGVKAEYFTVSGKTFKSAVMAYENRVKINNEYRPFISKITIYDELLSDNVTTLILTDPDFEDLPDYLFNRNLLRR